jgi:diguanylate cyclase (GGDEF)-like protein
MRFDKFRSSSWIPPLMALILLPCAVELGGLCDWTPGAASLLLLMIPVCVASLADRPWGLLLTTLVATTSSLYEGFNVSSSINFREAQTFPLVASGLLLILGPLLRLLIHLKQKPHVDTTSSDQFEDSDLLDFEIENKAAQFPLLIETPETQLLDEPMLATSFAGQSGFRNSISAGTISTGKVSTGAISTAVIPGASISSPSIAELLVQSELKLPPLHAATLPPPESIEADDPQLLLTLQEVGWRVATDFDLATLYQTVRHTTQRILRCQQCSVLLWNPQDATLSDALQNVDSATDLTLFPTRGMLGWVTKNRNLLVRSDVENDPALKYLQRRDENHIDAVAPLTAGGELLGLLTLEGVNTATPQFRRMLQLLANVSALAIKNARLFQRIAEMARRDGLTGLLNHASFQERLRELVDTAQCQQLPLTVIMADVDRFKSINDNYGHPVGDQVLREVGRIWRTVVPEYALSARYGGEEFICAIPGMALDRASDLAEALRHTIETLPLSFERGVLSVTASFGVAQLGLPARNATELVRLVDEALYQSKRAGRNRVTLVPPEPVRKMNHEHVPT